MKISLNRIYFYAGTSLLIVALIEVTILPYCLNMYLPGLYMPLENQRAAVMILYVAALLFYLSCKGYYKIQFSVIASLFLYYYLFQFIVGKI